MDALASEIAAQISKLTGLQPAEVAALFRTPPSPDLGDVSFPCFMLSKKQKRKPDEIAKNLAAALKPGGLVAKIAAAGPYVNFFRDRAAFAKSVLDEVKSRGEKYGAGDSGRGKNVVIDYSSPNIAKPFHVGHLRSTIIGAALKRIFQSQGFRVVGVNHLGDWGTQFGAMISAYKRWGGAETFAGSEDEIIARCFELYVRFHAEEEQNPALTAEKQEFFRRLEDGDAEMRELWKKFRDVSLAEFRRIYRRLGVTFESWDGEAAYNDKLDAAVAEVEKSGVLSDGERGAKIVDLKDAAIDVPAMVLKADGATTYLTRDVAAALDRWQKYQFAKNIYVVGAPQALHFAQLFATLKKMGRNWADSCVHVPFGHVLGMKTRAGNIVFLDEILEESVAKARKIITEKNPDLENRDAVAEAVGVGAIVVADLSRHRIKDYTFRWDEVLSFDGETGPYLQYALVRAHGILRTFAERRSGAPLPDKFDAVLLSTPEECDIIDLIAEYPETLRRAADEYEPALVTQYLFRLAGAFHNFHVLHRVVSDDAALTAARIRLADAVRQTLTNGFGMIGLAPLERM